MPSILPDYEYDIFISYRHNDNLDGWVTHFVESLEKELRGTLKESLTIYFDKNPHDGLLETHHVDKSLEGKLKCLIFIPILSQTYCDPKSFAWQHEFCAFNKRAQENQLGRDIKLSNGNVASRILPIKIHELDAEDTATFETEIGGVLRAIEFVHRSAGVNRSLTPHDDQVREPGKVLYRDQVNKVANAIKEILNSLKGHPEEHVVTISNPISKSSNTSSKFSNKIYALIPAVILLLALLIYFIKPQISLSNNLSANESSIAVLPFHNNTGKIEMDFYGVGVASEIRTQLALAKQFDFISSMQATLGYKNSLSEPKSIGEKLGVTHIISGIYQGTERNLRVVVELVEASSGKIIWSLPFNTETSDFYKLQASVASEVIRKFNSELPSRKASTTNLDAFAELAKGTEIEFRSAYPPDQLPATIHYKKAIQIDSSFLPAWARLIGVYSYHYFVLPEDTTITIKMIDPLVDYVDSHFNDTWERKEILGIYAYQVQQEYEKAKELFLEALAENPDAEIANDLIAAIYKRQLNTKEAIKFRAREMKLHNYENEGSWLELGIILRNNGNYEDAIIASNNTKMNWIEYRIRANLNTIEEASENYKSKFKNKFSCDQFLLRRDYNGLLQFLNSITPDSILTKNSWLAYKLYAHFGLQDDQRVNQIAKEFNVPKASKKERVNATDNLLDPEILAACLRNPKAKLSDYLDIDNKQFQQDPMLQCFYEVQQIQVSTFRKNYEDANTRLQQLNLRYPNFGDYSWLNRPEFDRIKEEYSPFQTTINKLKLPPKATDLYDFKR